MKLELQKEDIVFSWDIRVSDMEENVAYGFYNDDGYCDFGLFYKHADYIYYCPVWEGSSIYHSDDICKIDQLSCYEDQESCEGFYGIISKEVLDKGMSISTLYDYYIDLSEQFSYHEVKDPIGFDLVNITSTKPNSIQFEDMSVMRKFYQQYHNEYQDISEVEEIIMEMSVRVDVENIEDAMESINNFFEERSIVNQDTKMDYLSLLKDEIPSTYYQEIYDLYSENEMPMVLQMK